MIQHCRILDPLRGLTPQLAAGSSWNQWVRQGLLLVHLRVVDLCMCLGVLLAMWTGSSWALSSDTIRRRTCGQYPVRCGRLGDASVPPFVAEVGELPGALFATL